MRRCKHCQRFYNIVVNAKKVRPHQRPPSVACSRDEFLAWSRAQEAVRCAYCGILEPHLAGLSIRTSIGRELAAMGIDRIDNDGDYALANIHYCCLPCNKAKGNVFADGEMRLHLGPAIAAVWAVRRGTADLPRAPGQRHGVGATLVDSGACRRCGGVRVRASEGGRPECSDCARWRALVANAKKPRKRIAAPGLEVDEATFFAWARQVDGVCAYCGIQEAFLPRLRVRTQVGHPLRFLGVDRADNAGSYRAGNIVLACFPCNKVKGNVFSFEEMTSLLGPGVARIWSVRLAAEAAAEHAPAR